jgi:hypothetical protein
LHDRCISDRNNILRSTTAKCRYLARLLHLDT